MLFIRCWLPTVLFICRFSTFYYAKVAVINIRVPLWREPRRDNPCAVRLPASPWPIFNSNLPRKCTTPTVNVTLHTGWKVACVCTLLQPNQGIFQRGEGRGGEGLGRGLGEVWRLYPRCGKYSIAIKYWLVHGFKSNRIHTHNHLDYVITSGVCVCVFVYFFFFFFSRGC